MPCVPCPKAPAPGVGRSHLEAPGDRGPRRSARLIQCPHTCTCESAAVKPVKPVLGWAGWPRALALIMQRDVSLQSPGVTGREAAPGKGHFSCREASRVSGGTQGLFSSHLRALTGPSLLQPLPPTPRGHPTCSREQRKPFPISCAPLP